MHDFNAHDLRVGNSSWSERRWSSALASFALVAILLVGCGAPEPPELDDVDDVFGEFVLLVALAGDESSVVELDGATVSGVVSVHVDVGDGVGSVEFSVVGADEASVVVSGAPFSMPFDSVLFDDGEYVLSAVVRWLSGESQVLTAAFVVANGGGVPGFDVAAWSSVDVGVVGFAGESEVVSGDESVVLRGSGSDVWNEADGFRFTYQGLSGDGSLTVRVDEIEAVDEWTKVGVMVREGLAPDARNAFMLLTDFYGVVFQGRLEVGARTSDTLPGGHVMRTAEPEAPWWLRIERRGQTLIGLHSPDGVEWSELGRLTIALPHDALIGMAVTSRTDEAIATGVFSSVVLERVEPDDADDRDDDRDDGGAVLPPVPITGPTLSASYTRSDADFPNPERGWHGDSRVASDGFTLVRRYVRLDDYRYQALPASLLEDLRRDLSALREHGLKVVLRFSYNFARHEPDAPRDRVLQHIEQLAPVLQEHTDVIAVLQAGFIGAWGEWNRTTNDLLTLENRTAITNALLNAMDESRMIQIRYPYMVRDMFPVPPNAATTFDGSDASRVGQKNDCFVSSSSDGGTYLDSADYAYVEAVTRFTVMGGETCRIAGLNSRNDGSVALAELERYHYDYLNHDYWVAVIDKWRDQGYYDEISRRLGYRFVLLETTSQASVDRGQTLSMNVTVRNEGFGKLYNPRPINVVLRPVDGGAAITLRGHDDARQVLPLAGDTETVHLTVRVPADLAAGAYDVYLGLPDAADRLASDPRYAIRFANQGVWRDATGDNALNVRVTIND